MKRTIALLAATVLVAGCLGKTGPAQHTNILGSWTCDRTVLEITETTYRFGAEMVPVRKIVDATGSDTYTRIPTFVLHLEGGRRITVIDVLSRLTLLRDNGMWSECERLDQ